MPDQYFQNRGNGDGQGPDDLEVIIKKVQERFRSTGPVWIYILLGVILIGWLMTSVYTVDVDETGVVQRFGKYVRSAPPGMNFKLPVGIESVTKVRTSYVYKEEFGLRTLKAGQRTQYAPGKAYLGESLMLTGDLNVAVVPWIVQYRIRDERAFLFNVRKVQSTLRDLSESTMRLVVGDRSINEVITKREEIANQAQELLQKELNEAQTGLDIVTIEMKKTNVPEPVQASFNEVNQAVQEKEKLIYQAKERYNKAIPAARGEADRLVSAAEGYATDRINRARGDADRFLATYEEYRKARDVTRRRLFLEAMREFLPRIGTTYIVDERNDKMMPIMGLETGAGKGVAK